MKYLIILLFFTFLSCDKNTKDIDFSRLENASMVPGYKKIDIDGINFESTSRNSERLISNSKINLVFFGFPGCHGVCPTTIAALTDELKALPKTKRSKYKVVFVNVDEEAKLSKVKEFLSGYSEEYLGINPASSEDLVKLSKLFGAYSRKALPNEKAEDKIIHSSQVYVVSPDSNWVGYYSFPILKGKIASDFSKIIF